MASPSSPVHHASLVDPALHSPALLQLIDIKLSRPIIGVHTHPSRCVCASRTHCVFVEYVVEVVADTVDYSMGRSPSTSRRRSAAHQTKLAAFTTFVSNVLTRAEVATPVVLATLVYVDRAKPHLHIALEEWALERVFLGALMCASKVRFRTRRHLVTAGPHTIVRSI